MTLDQLEDGRSAQVLALRLEPSRAMRLMEMGLMEGERVTVLRRAPLGDPLELQVGDFRLSLRREDARGIEVQP